MWRRGRGSLSWGPVMLSLRSSRHATLASRQQRAGRRTPTCTGAKWYQTLSITTSRQHAHASHAVPRLRRPSASVRSAGEQRPHGPAAAAPQRPQCLPAPVHRHGQKAGWLLSPNSSDVHGGGGVAAHAYPQRREAHAPWTGGRDA
eukprot:366433-Chlamydomonas_euryale.AAC.10